MARIAKRTTSSGAVRWDVAVYVGTDPKTDTPKCIYKTFQRKKDAEKWAGEQDQLRRGGVTPTAAKETFGEYLAKWLTVKAGQVQARTLHGYRANIRRWIDEPPAGTPLLGPVRVDRLTVDHFDMLYAFLRERGLSPVTIRGVHVVLHQALKYAVKKRKLHTNPAALATVPKRAKDGSEPARTNGIARAMNQEEAARFLEAARTDRYSALWHVLLTGGLRPSEAMGLKWDDVDFEGSRIRVQRSLTRVGVDGWKLVPTKTKGSRRSVPLPRVAIVALRKWKAQQAQDRLKLGPDYQGEEGLVFTTELGTPLHHGNVHRGNFRRVMDRADLGQREPAPPKPKGQPGPAKEPKFRPAFRMYDLRHTCATLLLAAGVPLKVVSERLGHKSISTTADIYSHVLPTMQESAADEMEAMFGAGG